MSEDKREALRQKIAAGRQRLAERDLVETAREAGEQAVGFVKRHPLATLGGAVALGLVIGAMTKPGRRLTRRGGVLAALATDAALAYGMKLIDQASDAARAGREHLGDMGQSASETAAETGRKAGQVVQNLRDRIIH